jgi:hypothetical protein
VSPGSPSYVADVLAEGDALAKKCNGRWAARKEQERVIAAEKEGVTEEETAEDPLWAELMRLRHAIDKYPGRA